MSTPPLLAIPALFVTSSLLRSLPVFVRLDLSATTRRYLERVLPAAVFINLAVYIVYSEAGRAPLAALTSLGLVAAIAISTRLGLIATVLLGSGSYYLLLPLTKG